MKEPEHANTATVSLSRMLECLVHASHHIPASVLLKTLYRSNSESSASNAYKVRTMQISGVSLQQRCTIVSSRLQARGRAYMRSKAPSGGMKEMVRSFSKRASRTHWWNFMSSSSTALPLADLPWASNSTCQPHTQCFSQRSGLAVCAECPTTAWHQNKTTLK